MLLTVLLKKLACASMSLPRNDSSQLKPSSLRFYNPKLIVHKVVVILFLSLVLNIFLVMAVSM